MTIAATILGITIGYILPAILAYREIKIFHENLTYVNPSLEDVFSVICPFINMIVVAVYAGERLGKESRARAKNVNRKTFAEFFFRL